MMENGHHTRQEIISQPEAWSATLAVMNDHRRAIIDFHPARRYSQIIFTGCGSTYFLSLTAAAQTQALTGLPVHAFPASELWLFPRSSYVDGKTLLVAVSRSGETTETLRACEAFLASERGDLLTLSCYQDMPLAKMGKVNITLPAGQEKSVAQTRAFSSLSLATTVMAALWAGRLDLFASLDSLPEAGTRLLSNYASLAAELGGEDSYDRFYWLGSGARYGLACELSLKMKEMSLSHSEPFHFMEFRHGPKSMITPSALTVGLQSTLNGPKERAVLEEVKALGGQVLVITKEACSGSFQQADRCVSFESNFDEAVCNVLYLPVGQLIAFERSIAKDLNPDRPNNLESVVKL
jgi:glucosamine--fructose-6-phosphate aminotransferase (isomerizing)